MVQIYISDWEMTRHWGSLFGADTAQVNKKLQLVKMNNITKEYNACKVKYCIILNLLPPLFAK